MLTSRAHPFLEKMMDQQTFGKLFAGDFIERNGMSIAQLSRASGLSTETIEALINDQVALTREIAERLAPVFGVSADYFLNLAASCAK